MILARRFILLSMTFILATTMGFAQKRTGDPRPLSGLDATAIPTYKSVQAFLQAHPGANVFSAARPMGTARLAPFASSSRMLPLQSTLPAAPQLKVDRAPNGTARWLELPVNTQQGGLTLRKQSQTSTQAALAVLNAQASLMKLNNPAEELALVSTTRDELSLEHVRFQQVYLGVPVWSRDLYVHFNAQGAAYLINGTYEPTPVGVDVHPAKNPPEAVQIVVADLTSQGKYSPLTAEASSFLSFGEPTTELTIYPTPDGTCRLAYEVKIHANLVEAYSYIVDAQNGNILNTIALHCAIAPEKGAHAYASHSYDFAVPHGPEAVAGSFASATGNDLNGTSQSMRVWYDGSSTYYMVWDLPNLDAGKSQMPDNPTGGGMTISANNKDLAQGVQLFHNISANNTWTDPVAVSAHFNMKAAYDYYKNTFSRKAIDDKDQTIMSIIHVTSSSKGLDNAFWNGQQMIYGDGLTDFKQLAGGMDVSGHEMTHGVIQSTANLVYQNQSGALNESFADVFGVMLDRGNYLIGEKIMKDAVKYDALRDLANPKNPRVLAVQPASMAEFQNLATNQDNGGVHINSGIPNKAAYNVITAIGGATTGRAKAEKIYYRALTTYLTKNSQFGDCRKAVDQAAKDLVGQFGITSADAAAIGPAFDAVGITATTGSGGGSTGNEIPPVSGGKQYIAFMTATGQIGVYDVAASSASLFNSSSAAARASTGDKAQLSTGLNGKRIWFINQSRQLAFIDLSTLQVGGYPTLKIQQTGDLWNASVSPDESFVALSSAYANDPNLYIFDIVGNQLFKIPLLPESTQEGIKIETIQYPDVVSWSPNMKKPKIGFDAYNEVKVSTTGKVNYWGIYEIDFSATKIYSLIGSQPTTVSIGNITYGNTNPDLVAFNYIDASGKFDTYVANFDQGQAAALNIPSFTSGGAPIIDAERPTFSPNDGRICLSSPALNALLFYDAQTKGLSAATFQQPLFNPRWFVQGGAVPSSAESVEIPTAFRLHDNYPNPFNPTTKIEYEVPSRSHVQLAVYDLLGQLVRTLVNSDHSNGHYSVAWDGTNETGRQVASGMYIYRLEAAGGSGSATVLSKKMVLLK